MTDTKLDIKDNNLRLSVPFSKIDESKRTVYGFATLDNVDKVDDVVLADASQRAFESFRGNIREMHDLKAVGRMISFRPEQYYDPETQKMYNGIFVSSYISKGAPDTWEKVIDGTLTGFSIGAVVTKSSSEFDQETGRVVRNIEDYELVELSLVDNPMNNLANLFGIEKGTVVGQAAHTSIENVFFCRAHNVVQFSTDNGASCHNCGQPMSNIGFVESTDDEKITVVKGLLDNVRNTPLVGDYVEFDNGFGIVESLITSESDINGETIKASQNDPCAVIAICHQIGDTMIKTNRNVVKTLSNVTKKERGIELSEAVVEPVETVEVVDEVEEVSSLTEEEKQASIELNQEALKTFTESINALTAGFASLSSSIAESFSQVSALAQSAVKAADAASADAKAATAELAKANSEITNLGEQVKRVDSATATRKSADVGEIEQAVSKAAQSVWGGNFIGSAQN